MKMVSSPEIVPTTSGQSALSIAAATVCAEPVAVRSTVSEAPAVATPSTKGRSAPKSSSGRVASCGAR